MSLRGDYRTTTYVALSALYKFSAMILALLFSLYSSLAAEDDIARDFGLRGVPHLVINGNTCYIFTHKQIRSIISTGVSGIQPNHTFLDGMCVVTIGNLVYKETVPEPRYKNSYLWQPDSVFVDTFSLIVYLHPNSVDSVIERAIRDGCGNAISTTETVTNCIYVVAGTVKKTDLNLDIKYTIPFGLFTVELHQKVQLKTRSIETTKIGFLKRADGVDINFVDIVNFAAQVLR